MLVRVMNLVSRHILPVSFMCCLFLLLSCGSSHKAVKSDTEIVEEVGLLGLHMISRSIV